MVSERGLRSSSERSESPKPFRTAVSVRSGTVLPGVQGAEPPGAV